MNHDDEFDPEAAKYAFCAGEAVEGSATLPYAPPPPAPVSGVAAVRTPPSGGLRDFPSPARPARAGFITVRDMSDVRVLLGDCVSVLQGMEACSVSAVVTDPPYGLTRPIDVVSVLRAWCNGEVYHNTKPGFLGHMWDGGVPGPEVWREVLRVLAPGGHALVFSGARTYDLTVTAMRIAGFEVRDQLAWLYGGGFPKHALSLKPAHEPIVLARKPTRGKGAGLNVDACRIGGTRHPTNVLLDDEAAATLDEATRFFYCHRASRAEREGGLDHIPPREVLTSVGDRWTGRSPRARRNPHPTVKPLALMRYLVRLVTPPGGVVLDPFAGSGTTLCAAVSEGRGAVGIEIDPEYIPIIEGRVAHFAGAPK